MFNPDEPMSEKEFNTISKAVFYQLFNRKLSFVVFTGDEKKYHQWLFTNVDYKTMLVYDAKPDYFYSLVTIRDKKYLDKFYTLFPILKTTPCLIQVVDFLSSLSKIEDMSTCQMKRVRSDIILSYSDKNNNVVEKPIGTVLEDIDVDMYYTLWETGLIKSNHPYSKIYTYSEINEIDGRAILMVNDSDGCDKDHDPRSTPVVAQFGNMIPHLAMFLKNMSKESQSFTICAGYDKDSVLVNAHYDTDFLSCITTQPAQRWFIHKKKS